MQECLGINITDKLIKYAKVQKNESDFKVVSYGIRFYDNLELRNSLQQIVNETNSTKTPVSINIANEKYYYFDFFNVQNKGYARKAIETEFESFCVDNHLTRNAFEGRYIYAPNMTNADRNKVIYVYESKGDLNERLKSVQGFNLTSATPMATTLPNIIRMEKNKNIMIVDLNEKTTITTILNQNIYNIDTLDEGMKEAFDAIYEKENSNLKTYEVCKNTTIYTMEMQQNSFQDENSEYLQAIIPSLYQVAQAVSNVTKNYKKIDQIYLTGMGTVINNIDLYFQEFIKESKVEVLKPFFAEDDSSINIKDYIEVNSAIALAIQGMGYGAKTLNFCQDNKMDRLKSLLTMDIKDLKGSGGKSSSAPKINFSGLSDGLVSLTTNGTAVLAFLLIAYCVGITVLGNQIETKKTETQGVIDDTKYQTSSAEQIDAKINQRTSDYNKYRTKLENINAAIENKRSRKNQIPNLLNKILYNIPKGVQLTKIDNTEKTENGNTIQHIFIYAQSTKYEQLAYFKAKLKNASILDNVVSTEGTKDNGIVKIVIEGDLKTY